MEPLTAPAGWCAPSDQVYEVLPFIDGSVIGDIRSAFCPEWNAQEPDYCVVHEIWTGETYGRAWHSCKDEFHGPHDVCKCEDCGQERVVLRES